MELTYKNATVKLVKGDITKLSVDAIVNAANPELAGGGGVDGAIHAAAGPSLLEACRAYVAENGPLKEGGIAVTDAGDLSATHVIHAVGPVYHDGLRGEYVTLERTYLDAMAAAAEAGATTMAFPLISAGAYKFPLKEAALVGIGSIFRYLRSNDEHPLTEVVITAYDDDAYGKAAEAFDEVTRTHLGL